MHWVKVFIGIGVIVGSIPLACARIEPFVTWYYTFVWYGLILFMDSLRAARGKGSLIFDRPRAFLCLMFWSAAIWFLFEVFNFRLGNWYYVFASDQKWVRIAGSWLSFATVLPALYLIEKLLEDARLFASNTSFGIKMEGGRLKVAVLLGVTCLVLPLLWPRYAFPLIWACGFLLPLPWYIRHVKDTFLTDLTLSYPGRFLRILLAGMICGLLWEGFNFFATIRWIYTVPFLEEIKLFEMPPLGFLGFPPFALECAVMYGLLAGLGWAPCLDGWGRPRRVQEKRTRSALVAAIPALFLGVIALEGMEHFTIDSYTPRSDALELSEEAGQLLEARGISDCFQLEKALKDPEFEKAFKEAGMSMTEFEPLLDLALLRGMGTKNAIILSSLGIRSMAQLSECDPDEIAERWPRNEDKPQIRTRSSRIRIWIHAAGNR